MSNRVVSEDVIIWVWLRRELYGKMEQYNRAHPLTPLTTEQVNELVSDPDFQDAEENRLRRGLLWPSRGNLLEPTRDAEWHEVNINENQFKVLHVIRSLEWSSLSNYCGKLSIVAERAYEERNTFFMNPEIEERLKIQAINKIAQSANLDTNLILLESNDSDVRTILEGNHTAAALYIKFYIKKRHIICTV